MTRTVRRVEEAPMTAETQAILNAALALPEAERVLLAEQFLEAFFPEPGPCTEEEFTAELDRRAAELDRDPSIAIPLSDVLKED
jgi:putative addiction module component (TIGR02574 family)